MNLYDIKHPGPGSCFQWLVQTVKLVLIVFECVLLYPTVAWLQGPGWARATVAAARAGLGWGSVLGGVAGGGDLLRAHCWFFFFWRRQLRQYHLQVRACARARTRRRTRANRSTRARVHARPNHRTDGRTNTKTKRRGPRKRARAHTRGARARTHTPQRGRQLSACFKIGLKRQLLKFRNL